MTTTAPAPPRPAPAGPGTPPPAGAVLGAVEAYLAADPDRAALLDVDGGPPALDVVAATGAQAPVLAAVATRRPVVAVTATAREADELARSLRAVLPAGAVVDFPAWETLPHERLSPRSDTVARRLATLRRLAADTPDAADRPRVVVAPVRAVMQPFAAGLERVPVTTVAEGDEVSIDGLARALHLAAYRRVDMVERRGEFAVRGGIVDVFPPADDHPVRIELFGDVVDELRTFSVADQRSLERLGSVTAPPCRELLLTDDVRARAAGLVESLPGAREVLERVAEGVPVEGMESLLPVLVDRMVTVLDVVADSAVVVTVEPERIRTRAADLVATGAEFLEAAWGNATAGAAAPVDLRDLGAGGYRSLDALQDRARARGLAWWAMTALAADLETRPEGPAGLVVVDGRDARGYRGDMEAVAADLTTHLRAGWRVVVTTEGHGPAERLVQLLGEHDTAARLTEPLPDPLGSDVVHVTCAAVPHGFVSEAMRLAVLTETDLAGQRTSTRDMRRMPSRRRNAIDPETLRPGDYVVHETHGIGRFVEMTQREIAGATREYLVLEYAPSRRGQPGDRVFVPTDALDQVSRYVGGEAPSLSRMGGADWAKAKGRARKAVRQVAGELVQLYSARMATKGHAFGADTVWQRELEDAFPYAETPDQLATIDEVKADMEKPVPMDRLVCGDVGYGKTEIALRAAFKAVMDGRQVAVLVPTTLLVQQHVSTFAERYAGFPVAVRGLSRFSTDAEARAVLAGLADGSVDVVIGTHRLLGGEVRFKDLGLVVVDEEQRFGVDHKEALKKLRTNVDVLAMSATPIPRTLEMAVTGIREMSTLATPPEERHPILTYVGPRDDRQVAAAIRRELLREGQVFFVHNRVESIDRAAARLAEAVPEARVRVAHGQMNEHELERTVVDFWERRFDVLVCTTIVESGLDISNANTLVVDRADRMGLSQLHQLRGRVGRGRERGYAYILWDPEHTISETAHDRLKTIAANTDLGAGMQVALKDLEIRGAGNLLGEEQSGHIAGVGFDLYLRMVAEAVADFRRGLAGEEPHEEAVTSVDVPVDAYLPHDYVPSERLRLELYRRLAGAPDAGAVDAVAEELADRFGATGSDRRLPAPVEALLDVARFRVEAAALGLREVAVAGRYLRLAPLDLPESRRMRLDRLYPGSLVKSATSTVLVPLPTTRPGRPPAADDDLLAWCRSVVTAVVPAPGGASTIPATASAG